MIRLFLSLFLICAAPLGASASDPSISEEFVRVDRAATVQDWDAFLDRWQGQSDHPLYSFALEKRAALQPETAPAARTSLVPIAPTRTRDDAARAVQTQLKSRNCYHSVVDGLLGQGSRRALLNLSNVIGKDLELAPDASVARMEKVLAIMEEHPEAVCPVVVRPAKKPAPKAAQKTAPKAKPASTDADAKGGTPSYSRQDSTKLPPVRPSDCVGSRKKFYDCP